jgi:hypothetical protein
MLLSFATWLQDTALAQWVALEGFPWVESCHVVCITTVVGTVTIVDLRLLNLTSRHSRVAQISNDMLPFTWCAFALAALTGGLLFISKPLIYVADFPFQMMMLGIALAGVNMLIFHFTAYRRVADWDGQPDTPMAAKIAAALSLLFWATVIICGRWIGFTVR